VKTQAENGRRTLPC